MVVPPARQRQHPARYSRATTTPAPAGTRNSDSREPTEHASSAMMSSRCSGAMDGCYLMWLRVAENCPSPHCIGTTSSPNCGPKCASTRARLPRGCPGPSTPAPCRGRRPSRSAAHVAPHPSRPSPRTTLSERECQRPHLRHEPRAAPAASPPAPALFAVLAAAPRGTESSFS